jgi:NADH:ubiquinone oxidoreductase subunit F (NADH-binding)
MSRKDLTRKILTARFGNIDPHSIDDYIAHEGYSSLEKALKMTGKDIIAEIKTSGLKGRGGAAFPAGLKMEAVLEAEGFPKYIVCNADEGEPGNFKDRYLMENDPHQLIEGIIICAIAVGIKTGYIFIRGEYMKSIKTIEQALDQARNKGYLGNNILDSRVDFDMDVITGAGSYGRATYKPPFPTTVGLYNKPTQINNVETFCNIPHILSMGGLEYSKIGTESYKGTKLVCISGNISKPGLYEIPMGPTLREIIDELGGGVPNNREIKMVQLGGASGPLIPERMLDIKFDAKESQFWIWRNYSYG